MPVLTRFASSKMFINETTIQETSKRNASYRKSTLQVTDEKVHADCFKFYFLKSETNNTNLDPYLK